MGRNNSVPLLLSVFAIVITLDVVLTVPVSISTNGRALRSVTLHRRSSQDEIPITNLLLSQEAKRVNATQPIFVQRENKTDIGDGTANSTAASGVGSNEAEVDGDGIFNNETQEGSRLKQNQTEPCSLESSVLCSSNSTHPNRDKQRRIAHIVNYLWTNLFENRTRPVNRETPTERFTPVNPSSSSFSGGLQSVAVSCDLPPEVESEAWSSGRVFNLFFNLTSQFPDILGATQAPGNFSTSEQQQSTESGQSHEYVPVIGTRPLISTFTITPKKSVNIISAKLRLFKVGTAQDSMIPTIVDIEPSEPCNDTEAISGSDEMVPSVFPTRVTFPEFSPSADEKIRVSVFWYTQPTTKNHYKKKLVDAKMLSLRESRWVEFDIKNAVKAWLNDRKPNYGLVVEVENENQDALDPRRYFRSDPCFKSSSTSERANKKDEGINEQEKSDKAGGEINTSSTSPVIEICTLNVPETTTNYEQTKFFPFPMNINSLNHLQRVADSHKAKSSNASGSTQNSTRYPWQSINLRVLSPEDFGFDARSEAPKPTVVIPSHRHRHHHELNSQNENNNNNYDNLVRNAGSQDHNQQRSRTRYTHPRGFTLDEDHPLREILATVNGNSKEATKRPLGTQQFLETSGKGLGSHIFSDMPADDSRVGGAEYVDSNEHDKDVFITKIVITPAQLKESGLNGLRRGLFPLLSSAVPPTDSTNTER